MAMMPGNPHTYIAQWLQAATKGKVVAEFAAMVPDRVRFHCKECGLSLTANVHDPQTIDFGIQEFVKLHAHNGEYEKVHKPTGDMVNQSGKLIPLTADFKPVKLADGPTNVAGKIDEKPEVAAKIIEQVTQFSEEFASKLLDENIVKKIQELQSGDKGKVTIPPKAAAKLVNDAVKQIQTTPFPMGKIIPFEIKDAEWGDVPQSDAEVEKLEKELAKKRALENALKIKLLQKEIENLKNREVPVEPPKPTDAPLVFPEGRKFR